LSHKFKRSEDVMNEHLTDEEVEAIIKRYGEAQAGASTQPTVKDVAEALHVDPSVVAKLLEDVRGAKTQEDLQARLDALEEENAELRERAEKSEYATSEMWHDYSERRPWRARRRSPRVVALAGLFVMLFFLLRGLSFGGSSMSVLPLIILIGVLFVFLRLIKYSRR